jgi:hypothetical protein
MRPSHSGSSSDGKNWAVLPIDSFGDMTSPILRSHQVSMLLGSQERIFAATACAASRVVASPPRS